MARLYRPHIPLSVRIAVASRDCVKAGIAPLTRDMRTGATESLRLFLDRQLSALASTLGCEVSDLRLDHDPPLGARPQERRGLGKKTYYIPDANDPDHLFYRPHGAQYEGSHDVKTRIRGDHGQYSDIVLIKRERRRRKKAVDAESKSWDNRPRMKGKPLQKRKRAWPKRSFAQHRRKK